MKCKLSTINGWCGIFNKSCKECISPKCEFIKKAYRQGRVEAEYFGYHKREWIPVSERLPEKAKQVMCCDKQGRVFTSAMTHINSNGEPSFGKHYGVIAWRPLPEPYKGGDTE